MFSFFQRRNTCPHTHTERYSAEPTSSSTWYYRKISQALHFSCWHPGWLCPSRTLINRKVLSRSNDHVRDVYIYTQNSQYMRWHIHKSRSRNVTLPHTSFLKASICSCGLFLGREISPTGEDLIAYPQNPLNWLLLLTVHKNVHFAYLQAKDQVGQDSQSNTWNVSSKDTLTSQESTEEDNSSLQLYNDSLSDLLLSHDELTSEIKSMENPSTISVHQPSWLYTSLTSWQEKPHTVHRKSTKDSQSPSSLSRQFVHDSKDVLTFFKGEYMFTHTLKDILLNLPAPVPGTTAGSVK